jgi:hypothetical protein
VLFFFFLKWVKRSESLPSKMAKKLTIMMNEGKNVTHNQFNSKTFLRNGQKFNPKGQKVGLLIHRFSVLAIQVVIYM